MAKVNYTITLNSWDELEAVENATIEYLTTPDVGGAWFETKEEAREYLGDWFVDAVEYYMNCFGVYLDTSEIEDLTSKN